MGCMKVAIACWPYMSHQKNAVFWEWGEYKLIKL